MNYKLKDLPTMFRIYHAVEMEIEKFLSISAYAMKNKVHKIKSAESTLRAIEEYKKLPTALRKKLEKDKTSNVSRIDEIEKMCRIGIN